MKKIIYHTACVFLGILLSYLVHAVVEIIYLCHNQNITWYKHWGVFGCALPPVVQYILLAGGVIGGYFLGRFWWRIVYVEKRHWWLKRQQKGD